MTHIAIILKRSKNIFVILALVLLTAKANGLTELKYFQSDHRYDYRINLLTLAMDKTLSTDGPYSLMPFNESVTQLRGLHMLNKNKDVNVAFLSTTPKREKRFLSVKIPMLRGILGYRLFLIRDLSVDKFSQVNSLEKLKNNYMAGFGSQWADMKILTSNDVPVIGSVKYETLFGMLSNGRFDYFPRGINEAWGEIENHKTQYPRLMVEESMAFYYPYPVYFFVQKQNIKLASRIERGLVKAMGDGSFKVLFLKYHQAIIDKANLPNRKIFVLSNPNLTKQTPPPDTSWWLPKGRLH